VIATISFHYSITVNKLTLLLFCPTPSPLSLTQQLSKETKDAVGDAAPDSVVVDDDAREPERNAVPVDRQSHSHHTNNNNNNHNIHDNVDDDTEYEEDYYEDESQQMERFIPSKVNLSSTSSSSSSSTTTTTSTTTTSTTSKTTTTTPAPTTKTSTVRSRGPTIPSRRPFFPGMSRTTSKAPITTNDPNAPIYLSPQDNEIADSSNVKNNVPPNVNEPNNKIESDSQDGISPRLNLGMKNIYLLKVQMK